MNLTTAVTEELFDISATLSDTEKRIRSDAMDRAELLALADSTRPLLDRLHDVVEEQGLRGSEQTVAMIVARGRCQSAHSHSRWIANQGLWASEGAIRRQLLWASIAGQTVVELLTSPRHHSGIAKA